MEPNMKFRRYFPSFLVLISLLALSDLWPGSPTCSFAQFNPPGNNPIVSPQRPNAVNNPVFQQPASGFPTGGSPVATPGMVLGTGTGTPGTASPPPGYSTTGSPPLGSPPTGSPPLGSPTTGYPATTAPTGPTATTGTSPQSSGNYMIHRPLGAVQNGPQPGNPPFQPMPMQNGRVIVPPPKSFQDYPPTREEIVFINGFLSKWQEQSKEIEALDYEFTCQEHSALGTPVTLGRVKFRAPDKGLIEIDKELRNGIPSTETNRKKKIICTGTAIYEFNYTEKKLTEFVIPEEDRGKGIMDSPLMALMGAKPGELHERFYLRVLNPEGMAGYVCLQAWPKWEDDARDFKYANVAIDGQSYHAKLLAVYDPASDKDWKGYEITKVNKSTWSERLNGKLPFMVSKDEFDRAAILRSKPGDWMFETKTDFLPESSARQITGPPNGSPNFIPGPMSSPVTPQYGNMLNPSPNTVPMQPNMTGTNTPVTQGNYPLAPPLGTVPLGTVPQGTMPQGTMPAGQVYSPGLSQTNVPQTYPQPPNSYMARPPQGNTAPSTTIR